MRIALFLLLAGVSLAQADPGRLLRDEPLRSAPDAQAEASGTLARGEKADIRERRGGWYRVSTSRGDGWVRLLSLRREPGQALISELKGELGLEGQRIETRIVAVAGFRGGEEEDRAEEAGAAALRSLEAARGTDTVNVTPSPLAESCGAWPTRPGASPAGKLSLLSAWALNRLDAEHEARIGRALAGRLLNALPPARADEANRVLQRTGRRLLAALDAPDQDAWLFALLDSEEIHAFSTPGAQVFLTRGLYRQLRDEAELAAVLAREIARLDGRDLLRSLRQKAATLARPRDEKEFLRQLLGNGIDSLIRPQSVESEFQADRLGVLFALRAGYDPYGLITFLQGLAGLAENDPRLVLLSRTHPRADTRIERLSRTLDACLADQAATSVAESPARALPRID